MQILASCLVILAGFLIAPTVASAQIQRAKFVNSSAYLMVEVLGDSIVHFETAALVRDRPRISHSTLQMVAKTDYAALQRRISAGRAQSSRRRFFVSRSNPANLCVAARYKSRSDGYFTTFCPVELGSVSHPKGLNVDPAGDEPGVRPGPAVQEGGFG